jgi:hypothetical protein
MIAWIVRPIAGFEIHQAWLDYNRHARTSVARTAESCRASYHYGMRVDEYNPAMLRENRVPVRITLERVT